MQKFAKRANNIVYWREMEKGGHFAPSDAPELFAGELRDFFGAR